MTRESVTQFKNKLELKKVKKGLSKPYMSSAELKDAADYAAGNRLHLSDSFTRRGIRDLRKDQKEALDTYVTAYQNMVRTLRSTVKTHTDSIIKLFEKKRAFDATNEENVLYHTTVLLAVAQHLDTMYHETSTAHLTLRNQIAQANLLTDRTSMLRADSDPNLKRLFDIAQFLSTTPEASELDDLFKEEESSVTATATRISTLKNEGPRNKAYVRALIAVTNRLRDVSKAYSLYYQLEGPIAGQGFKPGKSSLFSLGSSDSLPSMENQLQELIDTLRTAIRADLQAIGGEGDAEDLIDNNEHTIDRNKSRETREGFESFQLTLNAFPTILGDTKLLS